MTPSTSQVLLPIGEIVLKVLLSAYNRKRGVICVVFSAPLLLAASASGDSISRVVLLDNEQVSHVQESVKAKLEQPDTATFYWMAAGWTANGILVCGNVESKNKKGSTGYQPFRGMLVGPRFTVEKIGDGLSGSDKVRASCLAQGVLL
jgi:hypothetical protein